MSVWAWLEGIGSVPFILCLSLSIFQCISLVRSLGLTDGGSSEGLAGPSC